MFIILSSQRSGSGFLTEALNSHPRVKCYGEVFLGHGLGANTTLVKIKNPPGFLRGSRLSRHVWNILKTKAWSPEHVFSILNEASESEGSGDMEVGLVCMYRDLKNPILRRYFSCKKNLKVLHLVRRNTLLKYVSHELMRNGVTPSHSTVKIAPKAMRINAKRFQEYLDREIRFERSALEVFRGNEMVTLYYEDMIDGGNLSKEVEQKVCNFLNLDQRKLTADLIKSGGGDVRDVISNYAEIRDSIPPQFLTRIS